MQNDIRIEAENLCCNFGDVHAVAGLNLQVRAGEMVGLVGPDGAGKTTTMRLLCGLLNPTSGKMRVAGYDVPQQVERAREHIGYIAQKFSLYGDLTITENIEFFGEVFAVPENERRARAKRLLEFAGLTEFADRRAAALSGGMQKKLALAAALVHQPEVLLLDEPTGAVDPVARQEFWHLLIGLLRQGSAVLVSTPYMDEAMRFNRVIFMNNGKAMLEGVPNELLKRLDNRILELAVNSQHAARAIAQADPDVEDVHAFGDRLHLRVREPSGPLQRLPSALAQANIAVLHLKPVPATLEDVFIELLENDQKNKRRSGS